MATSALSLGSSAPAFNLKGTDGKNYSLDSFNERKAFLIVFACNHCPYVQAYEERIKKIQSDYDADLYVVSINSNDDVKYTDDSFDEMVKRAKEKQFNFPYLRDEDQSVAKAYGATHTPEIFLFDLERKLAFHGKVDDNWQDESSVRSNYLRNAIGELLAGKQISVPETFTIGCTIKWK
ncbi:MAG: thiol-disulfide isomerase or thioredoxin [Ignavibacteria bacterium]|nr:MAG: thiol-disulfide isomerase or thioredoxin [Ignavibacteria bacterium]KAF0160067.1 MAG: thiol-disulfide isomerase or thioredoxin [Ignavibacteria bacterium]